MPKIKKINKGKWKYAIIYNGITVAYAKSYSGAKWRSNQIYGQMKRRK